jgi:isochorismate pyruvate lyase
MTTDRVSPEQCRTMVEVREGVDALDRAILELIAERFGYMRAAARIKQRREAVRDEERKAQVLANVNALAAKKGIPAAVVEDVYERLIEGSIAYELDRFDTLRAIT